MTLQLPGGLVRLMRKLDCGVPFHESVHNAKFGKRYADLQHFSRRQQDETAMCISDFTRQANMLQYTQLTAPTRYFISSWWDLIVVRFMPSQISAPGCFRFRAKDHLV